MSLKAFHVVFVVLATALSAAFGVWAIREANRSEETGSLLVGVGALFAAVLLPVYGVWFLRKLKGVSWL